MIQAIMELRGLRYTVSISGERILLDHGGVDLPDPETVEHLVEDLRSQKFQAREWLRHVGPQLPLSIVAWPDQWRESYEERAAIIEYDGGLERRQAEHRAEELLREAFSRIHNSHCRRLCD